MINDKQFRLRQKVCVLVARLELLCGFINISCTYACAFEFAHVTHRMHVCARDECMWLCTFPCACVCVCVCVCATTHASPACLPAPPNLCNCAGMKWSHVFACILCNLTLQWGEGLSVCNQRVDRVDTTR